MNIKQHIPIFVSSTYSDLIPYRKAVWDVLDKLKLAVNGMEVFGARSAEPLETCIQEVRKSRVFIAIIGMRFGSIDSSTGKSFVQTEYETAIQHGLDTLLYLIDEDNCSLPPKYVDIGESAQQLIEFKEFLRKKHTVESFTSPSDLANKLERDLIRLFKERDLVVEATKLEPLTKPEKSLELLKRFALIPDRYKASEIELIIKFAGQPSAVPDRRCAALGLPIGNSISRPIKVVEPANTKNYDFLDELYAQYSLCDFIYESPDDQAFKVVCKLAFGIEKVIVQYPLSSFWPSNVIYLTESPKDIATGETIRSYINTSHLKAIILVKTVGGVA